jgi:hypothetical protein
MAAPDVVFQDNRIVYRGLRNGNWVKNGLITFKAFLLRPANQEFPPETELSLGLTPQSAVDDLRENHGAGGLLVQEVRALPHRLTIQIDPGNDTKAYMYGLPMHTTENVQRALAITIATDLARISFFVPITDEPAEPPPVN